MPVQRKVAAGAVEKKHGFMGFRLRRKPRPGVSSAPADQVRKSSAECAIHGANSILLRRKVEAWVVIVCVKLKGPFFYSRALRAYPGKKRKPVYRRSSA